MSNKVKDVLEVLRVLSLLGICTSLLVLIGDYVRMDTSSRAEMVYHIRTLQPMDSNSVEVLAKTHPELRKACQIVGSCAFLYLRCVTIDGRPFWTLEVPGASSNDVFYVRGASHKGIDDAADDFINSARESLAKDSYKKQHPTPPEKPPVIGECNDNCGG